MVVDETSMVDVILASKLVKAVPPGAHLLLVGDVDQLPSVGAGEVLRDLLAAGSLPAVRLTRIFRQAQQSGIVINAHRINAGQRPQLTGFGDFFWFGCEDTGQTAGLVVDIVARRIPARFGLDPRRDVQVLCPVHRGPAGAGNLNQLLQDALTPSRDGAPERRYGGRVFRIGNKVTQLRNNYDKGTAGVFNGTVGVITAMSPEDHTLTVRTDEDEHVDYGFDELDELDCAYAVTIHRSQGSEYPAVVIPLTTSSWMMLQRNLLYTGASPEEMHHRTDSALHHAEPPPPCHVDRVLLPATRGPGHRLDIRFCRVADVTCSDTYASFGILIRGSGQSLSLMSPRYSTLNIARVQLHLVCTGAVAQERR